MSSALTCCFHNEDYALALSSTYVSVKAYLDTHDSPAAAGEGNDPWDHRDTFDPAEYFWYAEPTWPRLGQPLALSGSRLFSSADGRYPPALFDPPRPIGSGRLGPGLVIT